MLMAPHDLRKLAQGQPEIVARRSAAERSEVRREAVGSHCRPERQSMQSSGVQRIHSQSFSSSASISATKCREYPFFGEIAPTLLSVVRTQAPLRRIPPLVWALAMSAAAPTILEPETSMAIQGLSTLRPEISAWQLDRRRWEPASQVLIWARPIWPAPVNRRACFNNH